jgi:hypothetical protein
MTGRAKAPGLAGEHQQVFSMTVRTADPGKPRAGVTAVEVALDDLLNDRPEKPIEKIGK